jgi:hypothetical protein
LPVSPSIKMASVNVPPTSIPMRADLIVIGVDRSRR